MSRMQRPRPGSRPASPWTILLAALLLAAGCSRAPDASEPAATASLAVTGARIWTGDPERPWASALAVQGDTLLAVGDDADVVGLIGADTRRLDAAGGLVVPGFVDGHVHFLWGGDGLASVQLRDAPTPQAFTDRIAAFAADLEPGEWILNGTWDHENWGGELPRRDWIDAVTPDNPVWITRLDGHMALANSRALAIAGVTADTEDVSGGTIVRDADGAPTGVLKDNAMENVVKVY